MKAAHLRVESESEKSDESPSATSGDRSATFMAKSSQRDGLSKRPVTGLSTLVLLDT